MVKGVQPPKVDSDVKCNTEIAARNEGGVLAGLKMNHTREQVHIVHIR